MELEIKSRSPVVIEFYALMFYALSVHQIEIIHGSASHLQMKEEVIRHSG